MTENATAFDLNAQEYDDWFTRHPAVYQSELLAVQRAIP
jgi:hypothetical protein